MDPVVFIIVFFSYQGTFNVITVSAVAFPSIPDCFKTRIAGKINNGASQTFAIDQYYCNFNKKLIGKTILSSDTEIRGYIYDEIRNQTLRFNNTDCFMHQLKTEHYEPFNFVNNNDNLNSSLDIFSPLMDVLFAFQVVYEYMKSIKY